jgi:ABC-2 type transport system ATP-binding protein
MKCLDQVVFLAELKSVPKQVAKIRAEAWLERLDLSEWADKKVDALSKGMQQKIQLAATFLPEPELVILDEPFSGLDPLNIELLRNIILEERDNGCTIIFSTHILAEAEKICDSICLIEGGNKILDGNLEKIRKEYPLKTVKVIYHNDETPPDNLPGVENMELKDGIWKLAITSGTDTDLLLDKLRETGSVDLFSANRPSLEEIFLNEVHQQRQEVTA